MTKHTDDKPENWMLAGVRAKNANMIIKEIREHGPLRNIPGDLAEARKRKLERERSGQGN